MLVRVGKAKFEEKDRGKAVRVSNPFRDWGKDSVEKNGALEKKGKGGKTPDGIYRHGCISKDIERRLGMIATHMAWVFHTTGQRHSSL